MLNTSPRPTPCTFHLPRQVSLPALYPSYGWPCVHPLRIEAFRRCSFCCLCPPLFGVLSEYHDVLKEFFYLFHLLLLPPLKNCALSSQIPTVCSPFLTSTPDYPTCGPFLQKLLWGRVHSGLLFLCIPKSDLTAITLGSSGEADGQTEGWMNRQMETQIWEWTQTRFQMNSHIDTFLGRSDQQRSCQNAAWATQVNPNVVTRKLMEGKQARQICISWNSL